MTAAMRIGTEWLVRVPRVDRLPDLGFRRLLGEVQWRRLAAPIRERFGWKPAPGTEIRYVGAMAEVRSSAIGWLMAQACRLVGTPIAPYRGRDVPVTVTLRLDRDHAGIVWERLYHFPRGRDVCCRSTKVERAGEGLVECVGAGVGMWLRISERKGALHFESTGYFWQRGGWRLSLPMLLTPGALHVLHSDEGDGRFRFCIQVIHPLFGETFFQDGIFQSARS